MVHRQRRFNFAGSKSTAVINTILGVPLLLAALLVSVLFLENHHHHHHHPGPSDLHLTVTSKPVVPVSALQIGCFNALNKLNPFKNVQPIKNFKKWKAEKLREKRRKHHERTRMWVWSDE
jgi:hypothetical protein